MEINVTGKGQVDTYKEGAKWSQFKDKITNLKLEMIKSISKSSRTWLVIN